MGTATGGAMPDHRRRPTSVDIQAKSVGAKKQVDDMTDLSSPHAAPLGQGTRPHGLVTAASGVWALLFGMGLLMLGNGLQGSLLGIRASIEGFGTTVTGLVMSGYFIGFLGGSTLAPRIVTRVGHIRVFAALASLASIAILIQSVLVDEIVWTVMRILTGFSFAGLYIVTESWLNARATNETRGQMLALYMMVVALGVGGGQFLLNLSDPQGHILFILVSVLVSFSLVPILLSANPAPDYGTPSPVGLRELYEVSPLGVVGGFITGVANGAVFGMAAVYGREIGLSVLQISAFLGFLFLGGALFQWPIGRLSDRYDRRTVIALVALAAAVLSLVAGAVSQSSAVGLIAIALVFGGTYMPLYSLCIAHTNDFLEPRQMVAASASLVLIGGVGAILGPPIAGATMALAGPNGYFWFLAMVHGAIAVFAIYRMTRRVAVPLDEQGTFVAVPSRLSPLVAAIVEDETPSNEGESAWADTVWQEQVQGDTGPTSKRAGETED